MGKKNDSAPAPKKLNIYKVVTTVAGNSNELLERVDYVRAKTKAGAVAIVAATHITADLARAEDLLALANVSVKG